MKKNLTILFIFLLAFSVFSQDAEKKPTDTIVIPEMGDQVKLPDNLPQTSEEYYDYADKLWRKTVGRGSEDKVLEYLNKAVELNPNYADAFYFRGFVNNRTNKFKEAVSDFTRTLEIDPTSIRAYELRAETKIKLKDFKGALADYDEFITRFAADGKFTVGSYKGRGRLKYFLGDYDGAIQDFSKALTHSNGNATENFLRGAAYLKKGDKISALEDFKKISDSLDYIFAESVKKYPEQHLERKGYPANENPLAVLDKNAAKSEATTGAGMGFVVEVDPKTGKVVKSELEFPSFEEKLNLDNWFNLNSNKYYSVLLLSDESSVIYYHYGLLLAEQNKPQEAEDALTKALSYNYEGYKNDDAWFQRGKIRLADKNFEAAVRDLSWAISINRRFPDSYLERGIALLMLGHDEIARKDFNIYSALNPAGKQILQTRIDAAKKLRAELNKK